MCNSDNEKIHCTKFAVYEERSSSAGINHLIAFELINPLLYIYFPSFEFKFFNDLKFTLLSSVTL